MIYSVADGGEGPGGPWSPLFLNQTETRRAKKIFWRQKTSENRGETFAYLEISSRPQAIENSRQYLLLRKDNLFYEKQSLGAPDEGISE